METHRHQPIVILLIVLLISTLTLLIVLEIRIINSLSSPKVSREILKETVIVEVTSTPAPDPTSRPTVFPNSKNRLVFLSVWENEIYIINSDGSHLARVTSDGSEKLCPRWHPDGKRISYYAPSHREGYYDLVIMDSDGENREVLFQARLDKEYIKIPQWSSDGTKVTFAGRKKDSEKSHIYVFDGKTISRLTSSGAMERSPVWSPDGNKIAYISYHKDQAFHVVTAIDTIRSWLISELPADSYSPVSWSPDGKYIAFSSDHNLYISEFGKLPNNEQQTMYEQGELKQPSWAPTGDKIAYYFSPFHCCGSDIYALSTEKHNKLELQTSQIWAHSSHPIVWSPDGKSVVVVGDNNSKNWNLYKKNQGENKAVEITDSERRDACPDWEPQK